MMGYVIFIDKRVVLQLSNGWIFRGIVQDATNDTLTMIDETGKRVFLHKDTIIMIREVHS